jgi:AraC family transcriptional regulator of adaptative response / DNA-3-methyladenine glycosylase II
MAGQALPEDVMGGEASPIGQPALTHLFPTAQSLAALADADYQAVGVSIPKIRAIRALAHRVASGDIALDAHATPEQTVAQLLEIDGIGDWTAQYVAMRALGWPDAFPATDYALRKVLGVSTARAMQAKTAQWAPWRAYAAIHLWHRYELCKDGGNARQDSDIEEQAA